MFRRSFFVGTTRILIAETRLEALSKTYVTMRLRFCKSFVSIQIGFDQVRDFDTIVFELMCWTRFFVVTNQIARKGLELQCRQNFLRKKGGDDVRISRFTITFWVLGTRSTRFSLQRHKRWVIATKSRCHNEMSHTCHITRFPLCDSSYTYEKYCLNSMNLANCHRFLDASTSSRLYYW